jgi:hypothetical protein
MIRGIAILIAAAALACAVPAAAANPDGVRQACASDAQRLCGGLHKHKLRQCISAHQADLSSTCKGALAAAHLKAKELKPE